MRTASGLAISVYLLGTLSVFGGDRPIIRSPHKIPGVYLVTLNSPGGTAAGTGLEIAAKHGAQLDRIWDIDDIRVVRMVMPEHVAELVAREDNVAFVEEDFVVFTSSSVSRVPASSNTPEAHIPWSLDRIDQRDNLPIKATYNFVYPSNNTGANVVAYVFDNGVQALLPDRANPLSSPLGPLPNAPWVKHNEFASTTIDDGKNYAVDDCWADFTQTVPETKGNNPRCGKFHLWSTPERIQASHGTSVASALAGRNYGTAPAVSKIVPMRVLAMNGSGTGTNVLDGITEVLRRRTTGLDTGAAVANMSFWKVSGDPGFGAMENAIYALINNGVTVFASANNKGDKSQQEPFFACNTSPARLPRVITVGGVERDDKKTRCFEAGGRSAGDPGDAPPGERCGVQVADREHGSNSGPCVDIYAPGWRVSVASLDDNLSLRPLELATGTSFAAPLVAGVAATYLQHHASASPFTVWHFLRDNATEGRIPMCPTPTAQIPWPDPTGCLVEGSNNALVFSRFAPISGLSPDSAPLATLNAGYTFYTNGSDFQSGLLYEFVVQRAGSVYTTSGSAVLTGVNTNFVADLVVGGQVMISGWTGDFVVQNISSATSATLTSAVPLTLSGRNFFTHKSATNVSVNAPGTLITAKTPTSLPHAGHVYPIRITNQPGNPAALASTSFLSRGMVAEFSDVPLTHPQYGPITSLVKNGITAGCGPGSFCPATVITREVAAVLFLTAEHGNHYQPPPARRGLTDASYKQTFFDVLPGSPYWRFIEQMYKEGIAGGCGGGDFCATSDLTRSQFAVFSLRIKLGPSWTPADRNPNIGGVQCYEGRFADVHTYDPLACYVEELDRRAWAPSSPLGLCPMPDTTKRYYCPEAGTTRADFAQTINTMMSLQ